MEGFEKKGPLQKKYAVTPKQEEGFSEGSRTAKKIIKRPIQGVPEPQGFSRRGWVMHQRETS